MTDANIFWELLQIGTMLSGLICPVVMLVMMKSDKKQRREVSFEFEPVGKTEFKEHVGHNTRRHAELFNGIADAKAECGRTVATSIQALREEMNTQSDRRDQQIDTLKEEISSLSKQVSGLASTCELQNSAIATTNTDIKLILQRLPHGERRMA